MFFLHDVVTYEARTPRSLAVSGVRHRHRHNIDARVRVEFDVFDRYSRVRVRVVFGVRVSVGAS